MFSLEELKFAQRYPFSAIAKRIVVEKDLSLDSIPEEVVGRAKAMVAGAIEGRSYTSPHIVSSEEALENEILAFPLAKVIVAATASAELRKKFADTFSEAVFSHMGMEDNETLGLLAAELGVAFAYSGKRSPVFEVELQSFLGAPSRRQFMKLVNQQVANGRVCLNRQDFTRFLAEVVRSRMVIMLRETDVSRVPAYLKGISASLNAKHIAEQKKHIEKISFGAVKPAGFPPCMAKLYSELTEGKNIPHLARFDLASFLAAVGMGNEQIISVFRNAPNFNEKITRYQVERISGKARGNYIVAGCAKLRAHGICVSDGCEVSHPLQLYRRFLQE